MSVRVVSVCVCVCKPRCACVGYVHMDWVVRAQACVSVLGAVGLGQPLA